MQSMPGLRGTLPEVGVSSIEESSKLGLEGMLGTGQKALLAQCIWNILWAEGALLKELGDGTGDQDLSCEVGCEVWWGGMWARDGGVSVRKFLLSKAPEGCR